MIFIYLFVEISRNVVWIVHRRGSLGCYLLPRHPLATLEAWKYWPLPPKAEFSSDSWLMDYKIVFIKAYIASHETTAGRTLPIHSTLQNVLASFSTLFWSSCNFTVLVHFHCFHRVVFRCSRKLFLKKKL